MFTEEQGNCVMQEKRVVRFDELRENICKLGILSEQ